MPGLKPSSSARRNANRARCQFAHCDKFAQTRGLCKAHGGGSRCRDPLCNKLAQSRGLCIAHGGGRRCQFDGCTKLAQSKGYCISHGGGRRCTFPNCEKFSQVKGRCKSHSKLAAAASASASVPTSPQLAAMSVMTPPSSVAKGEAAVSPSKTKLSIDFLVNPLLSRGTSGEFSAIGAVKREPLPSFASRAFTFAPARPEYNEWQQPQQPPAMALPSRFAVQPLHHALELQPQTEFSHRGRSLVSFLEPRGSSPAHPLEATHRVLPPLALYH